MIGTFAYLILTSARNQVRARLARLRNPRYALALAIGIGYVWMVYLRPSHDGPRPELLGNGVVMQVLPFVVLLFLAWTWLTGGDRTALAFSQAEVTLLFTAPVSRRTLVLYKIARTQLRILLTSIVWTLLFRQSSTWSSALVHAVGYWVLLSTLNLNRLGAALVRAGSGVQGLRVARRNWVAIAVFTTVLALVAVPLVAAWPSIRHAGTPTDMLRVVTGVLSLRPASWALYPIGVVLGPLVTPPGVEWFASLAPALLLIALMTAWVLTTDAAFEESAVEASALQARRLEAVRARRGVSAIPIRAAGRTIPLSPTGAPAVALLWKNALWLMRSGALRGLLWPPAIALVGAAVLAPRSQGTAFAIAVICVFLAVVMLLAGPLSIRNDLRTELLHVSLMQTYPLRGRDIVMAEVASSALPLAAMQYLLLAIGLFSSSFAPVSELTPRVAAAILCGAVPLLVGLNLVVSTIHNALAILFPGWVRLGAGGGGIETLGLGMINLGIALVMLGVLLIVPAVAVGLAFALLRAQPAAWLLVGASLAGVVLVGEWVVCAWALGGALERVEPMHVES